ncbi:MAG: DUF3853 family protein [Clostridiales bacterium]|nr:DUF3853 family protein [Clostridiales bacterium]
MGAIENIRVADLTVGQFAQLMRDVMAENMPAKEPDEVVVSEDFTGERYVYGINGIARLFGCSRTYAQRLKSSGKLAPAIRQEGRKIMCDAQKAVELFGARKHCNQ